MFYPHSCHAMSDVSMPYGVVSQATIPCQHALPRNIVLMRCVIRIESWTDSQLLLHRLILSTTN